MLESYYLLFIHGAVKGSPHNHDYDALVSRALNTSVLGEHVAPRWSLGAALRWTPPISRDTIQAAQGHLPDADLTDALAANPAVVRSVGLYKVMGEAVQAVVGGVYHQFVCIHVLWSWDAPWFNIVRRAVLLHTDYSIRRFYPIYFCPMTGVAFRWRSMTRP